MPTAGPNSAGAGATSGGSGPAWTNPGNVVSSNNTYATCVFSGGGQSETLRVTQFGFALPTATIDGITVEIEAKLSGGTGGFVIVQLTKDGTSGAGDDLESATTDMTTSDTYYTYGSASNLWGTTWTAAEINATTFGVLIGTGAAGALTISIDHVRITVTYTNAGGTATKVYQYRLRRAG